MPLQRRLSARAGAGSMRSLLLLSLVGLALLTALVVWLGSRAVGPPDILLISIDTLRADHLGCYGHSRKTPAIDRLANEGLVFENAMSTAPLTLPSHASLLTGLTPPVHGVRTNAEYRLPDEFDTIAEKLSREGYQTGAFIGGRPLASAGGLAQGFDVYDDDMTERSVDGAKLIQHSERFANEVFDLAADWLRRTDPKRPVFCFVHLYDPHAPGAQALPGESLPSYDGEIAFVDRSFDAFQKKLRGDRWANLVTIITSDHGEGLGEHREETHAVFVYESTLRIPLLIHGLPGETARRIENTVGLIDVAPTVLEIAGADPFGETQGVSLLGDLSGSEERFLYFESFYARHRFGWAPLRGVRQGTQKYIDAPAPELFDLRGDPGELSNLYSPEASVDVYRSELSRIGPGEHARIAAQLTEEQRRELEALGYVSAAPVELPEGDLLDPKDMIDVIERFRHAHQLFVANRIEQSLALYADLEQYLDNSPRFYDRWCVVASRAKQWAKSVEYARRCLNLDPTMAHVRINLSLGLRNLDRLEDAWAELERVLVEQPDHVEGNLWGGRTRLDLGDRDGALRYWKHYLELAPNHRDYAEISARVKELEKS